MTEPIMVPCEGSGCPGHRAICPSTHGVCPVCGRLKILDDDGRMPEHDRPDVVAKQGDFG